MQNLEEKELKLHQTQSNFRTGNSFDLDGKHLPERCSNSVSPGRTDNYRNTVPAAKCLPERHSGAFRHHYTTGHQAIVLCNHASAGNRTLILGRTLATATVYTSVLCSHPVTHSSISRSRNQIPQRLTGSTDHRLITLTWR